MDHPEWFNDASLTDEALLERCKRVFRRGPIGLWSTYGDHLTLDSGLSVVFAENGLGVVYFWDVPFEKHELKIKFHWRSDRDFELFLEPIKPPSVADRWGKIHFGFRLNYAEQAGRTVRMFEVNPPDNGGERESFWWSTSSLELLSVNTNFENLPGEDV